MNPSGSLRAILAAAFFAANFSFATAADPAPAVSANYTLAPADILNVAVAGDPKSACVGRITSEGTFSLPYLDHPVKLSGLTVSEAVKAIAKLYVDQQIFVNPQVSLTVSHGADRHINVIGHVTNPGSVTFPPWEPMTLVSAVSAAGGIHRLAVTDVTIIRQLPNGKTETIHANLRAAMEDSQYGIPVEDGDTIIVPEAAIAL